MKKLLSLVAVLLITASCAFAQIETGSINGTVTDTSGAVVVGAAVTARNVETGFSRSAVTNSTGLYSIVDMPAGTYSIIFKASNFAPFEERTSLFVGQPLTINPKLGATATAIVDVAANGDVAQLNTTTSELATVVTPEDIESLPSLTRNPYDFVVVSGNISTDVSGGQGNGVGFAVGGGRSSGVEVLLDGIENLDLYSQSVAQPIPLDAVQEFRLITGGFDSRYGRATGGVVNLTTKTGTNKFHGSAYEYNRVSALASNTYYEDASNYVLRAAGKPNNPSDHFVRNQFGYSVGGPVFRDKLFFFSSTEWERVRASTQQTYVIPTAAFIATTAANTQAFFTQYGKIRPGATLGTTYSITDPAGIAPPIVNALQQVQYTVPATTTAGTPQNSYFTVNRVDYTVSKKTNLFARYGLYSQKILPGASTNSPYAGFDASSSVYNQAALFSLTHSFTDHLLDVVKLSYSRINNQTPLGANPAGPTLYTLATATTDKASNLGLALPGYLPFSPGSGIPAGGPSNFYQFNNDLEYIKGRHDIHVGGSFEQLRDNRVFGAYENSVNQLSSKSEFDGFNQLIKGKTYAFTAAINPQGEFPCVNNITTGAPIVTPACTLTLPLGLPNFERNNTFNDGAVYAQDSYKVVPNVTVTAGLRWEYFGVQHNHNPNLESNFFLGSGTSLPQQFRNGAVATTPNSPVGGLYAQDFKNYSPRIGLAWDLFGDGKYTIRSGYGLSYERNYGNVTYNVIQNPPAYGTVNLTAIDSGGGDVASLPISNSNFGPLAGTGTKPFPVVSLRPVAQNIKTAYQQNYTLSIAHQFGSGILGEIAYSGARGIHLYSIANVNRTYFGGNYFGDTRAVNRTNLQYAAANLRGANGDSYYNSVNFHGEFDRLRSAGLSLQVNYTIAHSLDDNSSTFDTGNGSGSPTGFLGYLDPFNPKSSYGNSDFDVHQRISIGAIYQPNYFKNHGALVRETLGGLTFAPIVTGQSGFPFNITDNSNTDGQATPNIFAAPGLKYHGTSTPNGGVDQFNYILVPVASKNTGVNPVNGRSDLPCNPQTTPGCSFNKGIDRNQFFGPGNYQVNLGAYKTFTFFERYKLQIRAEAYNLFNHSNYYVNTGASADYSNTTSGTTPGYIVTAKGATGGVGGSASDERRNIQLAARFEF